MCICFWRVEAYIYEESLKLVQLHTTLLRLHEELLYAAEPVDEPQHGGEDADCRQGDVHPHDEVVVDMDVLDDIVARQVVQFCQQDDRQVARHPDDVDRQRAGQEQHFAGPLGQIHQQGPGKIVQEISIGNENRDGAEDDGDGELGAHAAQDGQVEHEGGEEKDHGPQAEIHEEERETGKIINHRKSS